MKLPRIILASTSPRRSDLLRKMRLRFKIVPSNVEEIPHAHLSPREWTMQLAFAKAREVARQFPDAVVIGADTIVVLEQKIFGKPRDLADAEKMLRQLQGRMHRVITGVCVLHLSEKKKALFAETTKVTFKKMTTPQIRDYFHLIHPLDKAGAYAAQEHTDLIIKRVEGDFDNVVGLPTERLAVVLEKFNL